MKKTRQAAVERAFVAPVFVDPLTDFGFKKVFHNKEKLMHFLNEILSEERITKVEYLPVEQLGRSKDERRAVFDIYCTNEKGEHFIVEMQSAPQRFFSDRAIFYTAFPIRSQAQKGEWDYHLKAVYFVGILDHVMFAEPEVADKYIENVYLYRETAKKKFSDTLHYVFIELPKFTKQAHELQTPADVWLYTLKNMWKLAERPAEIQDKFFAQLYDDLIYEQLTEEEKDMYRKNILDVAVVRDQISYSYERGALVERGKLMPEITAIKKENVNLHTSIADRDKKIAELEQRLQQQQQNQQQ
ncbi:MAG: Rpn family recombination-promoting nuclease/putative transposase [Prevotellaceae bacterium]|jgi:predicted transposase/invertase (TIGR01784 family)|nr:Rpn family recombination-promoting nuclease/putative transposase [Prevotellaceae bacterium]